MAKLVKRVRVISDGSPAGTRIEGVPYAYKAAITFEADQAPTATIWTWLPRTDATVDAEIVRGGQCPHCHRTLPVLGGGGK